MTLDLNEAERQGGQLIPPGPYWVRSKIKARGAGDEGLLRAAKNGPTIMLELVLTVASGEHAGHTLVDLITVDYDPDLGPLSGKDDNFKAARRIGRAKLRAIIESARNIRPDDDTPEAQEGRRVESFLEFDNLTFAVQIDEQPARNGFRARNIVDFVIVPGDPAYPAGVGAPAPAGGSQVVVRERGMDDEMIPF